MNGLLFRGLKPFQPLVEFHSPFQQKKQAADKQDNVPGRKRIAQKGKPRFCEPDQPCNSGKQSQTHDQGKRKANGKRVPALVFR